MKNPFAQTLANRRPFAAAGRASAGAFDGSSTSATDRKGTSVTRLAKAMSVFNFGRSGSADGRDARSLAPRDALLGAEGSGARSCIGIAFTALAMLFALSVGAASAQAQAKSVLKSCGTPNGAAGGQVSNSKGVSVNTSGNGAPEGSVYAVDGSNNRVSQFDEDCGFVRAWGYDVVASGEHDTGTGFEICEPGNSAPGDICKVGLAGVAAGQLNGSSGISVDQSNGYVYVVSASTSRRVDVFSPTGQFAGAFGWDVDPGGGTELEVCITSCKAAGAAGSQAGNFQSLNLSSPAIDPSASPGTIYVPDLGNARVSQYSTTISGAGVLTSVSFLLAFGWDVDPGGGTEFEICTLSCKVGTSGPGAGQFGPVNTGSPTAVAVDSTGAVYVTSGQLLAGSCSASAPCRVQKFSPDLATAEDFGPTVAPGQLYFSSGAANTVAPVALSVDPSNDHLFVLRRGGGEGGGTPSSSNYQVHEYESDGTYVETHPGGAALPGPTSNTGPGLGVGIEERVYANMGVANGGQIFVLGPIPKPEDVTMIEVTGVTSSSATFKGSITIAEPGGTGFEADYHFEYSDDGITWERVPGVDLVTESAAGTYEVEATAKGLDPSTGYVVRLVATTSKPVESNTLFFKTLPGSPVIEMNFAGEATKSGAELGALINPGGEPASYHFEWASEEEWQANPGIYGHRVPPNDRAIGSGVDSVLVAEQLTELAPQSAYHYRVVVRSGKTSPVEIAGGDSTFETLNSCGLTDNRCFELVTPTAKGPVAAVLDGTVTGTPAMAQVAASGSAVAYNVAYGFPDATAGYDVLYQADRVGAEWDSHQLSPPSAAVWPDSNNSTPSMPMMLTRDLSCGLFTSSQALTADAPQKLLDQGDTILYMRDASGAYTAIANQAPTNVSGEAFVNQYVVVGASESDGEVCDRVVFRARFIYPGAAAAGASRAYEWARGEIRSISVVPGPSGLELADTAVGAPDNLEGSSEIGNVPEVRNFHNAVSEDASRIFFQAKSAFGGDIGRKALFVRDRMAEGSGDLAAGSSIVTNLALTKGSLAPGQQLQGPGLPSLTTVVSVAGDEATLSKPATENAVTASLDAYRIIDVSQSQKPGTDNNGPSRYETASRDGSYVFFTARRGLATNGEGGGLATLCQLKTGSNGNNGPGCDLYRYSVDSGTLEDISVPGAGASNAGGAGVTGVLVGSEDGARVYFAARGQLIDGAGRSEAGNLATDSYSVYLWEEGGGLDFVGAIGQLPEATKRALTSSSTAAQPEWTTRATEDGGYLLYESSVDPADFTDDGKREAYLYSAETGMTQCVSCRRDGKDSVATAGFSPLLSNGDDAALGRVIRTDNRNAPPTTLIEDGSGAVRVYFMSPNRLASGASEGVGGTYQWKDGQVSLVAANTEVVGVNDDGTDIFLGTRERLTWEDTDAKVDVYDARVGGGFAPPPPPPPACNPLLEMSCQAGSASSGTPPTPPPSAVFAGPGNLASPPDRGSGRCAKLARNARAASAKSKRLLAAARKKDGRAAHKLRRRAKQASKSAKRASQSAKRCRGAYR